MKNEFTNKLTEDEKILFHSISNVSKTNKQFGRFLLGAVLLSLFWILTIKGMKSINIPNFNILI